MVVLLGVIIAPVNGQTAQDHYVRGNLQRVSESISVAGGSEDDARGAATPRISGDGNKVVFYSDAYFSADTAEQNNDYHIWMADVTAGNSAPFPKTNVYNHPTYDSKGPAVSEDGSKVVFGRSDDKIMLWSATDTTAREIADNTYDSTGDCDIR